MKQDEQIIEIKENIDENKSFYDELGEILELRLKNKYQYSISIYKTFLKFAVNGIEALKFKLFQDERYPKTNIILNTVSMINLPMSLTIIPVNLAVFSFEWINSKRIFLQTVYEVEKNRNFKDINRCF
jgi:hypothetical protein